MMSFGINNVESYWLFKYNNSMVQPWAVDS
jgi:hypothetical protein